MDISLTVFSMEGEDLGAICVDPSGLGREVVSRVRALHGVGLDVIITLLFGLRPVQSTVPIAEQGLADGAQLQLCRAPVDPEAQRRVAAAVLAGEHPGEEWQVWESVQELEVCTSLPAISLPSALQSLTFAGPFDQPMDEVALPSALQSLACCGDFNQPMDKVALPSALKSLTFRGKFNRSMDNVALPSALRSLTLGRSTGQDDVEEHLSANDLAPFESITIPSDKFNQPMDKVALPSALQSLAFGDEFDQPMDKLTLPDSLQSLTFGYYFNQPMDDVALPSNLQSLSFGIFFDQPLDKVALPSALQRLTVGASQSMDKVVIPDGCIVGHADI